VEDKVRRASTTQSGCGIVITRRRKIRRTNYLKAHPNIQIIEMSTKYFKKREKGLGLKIKVKLKERD